MWYFCDFFALVYLRGGCNQEIYYFVKKSPMRSFFWSVFPIIQTEYEDLLYKSPYLVGIGENTDLKKVFILIFFTQN